jgi:hypothetical protein
VTAPIPGASNQSAQGDKTMANESKTETPSTDEEFHTSKTETEEDKKIDRIAQHAAERAGNTEKRYDQDHDIFTK